MSTVTAVSADGTRISALRVGSGPALLLVHGIAADASRWQPVLDPLAQRFTVYALDRRGHGASGDAPSYALAREAEDVEAIIAAIGEDVHLFGHSFGGLVALEAVASSDVVERSLRSVAVYEPYVPEASRAEPSEITRSYEALAETGDRDALIVRFLREILLASEREIAMLRAHPSWAARLASAHTLPREMAAAECYAFDPSRFAQATRIPVSLLVGSESPPFLIDSIERLHRALPGSDLVRLRGQKHVAMNTAPAMFVDAVIAAAGHESA